MRLFIHHVIVEMTFLGGEVILQYTLGMSTADLFCIYILSAYMF